MVWPLIIAGAGLLLGAVGDNQAASSAKQAGKYNANILLGQATQARKRGKSEAQQLRYHVAKVAANQRVSAAGRGWETGSGTPMLNEVETARQGELDVLTLLHNSELEAWGLEEQAKITEWEGAQKKQGGQASGLGNLLGGLGGLFS